MTNFQEIKKQCEKTTVLSKKVIDDFLMYYAAAVDNLHLVSENKLNRFRNVFQRAVQSWRNFVQAQFIVHRIFRPNGLIRKYLAHEKVRELGAAAMEFLEFQKEHPWRFSFSRILGSPHADFYTMQDVISGEEYLLYSPAIQRTLRDKGHVDLWFVLLSFQGECCQTFGPVVGLQGLDNDDLFFFASEAYEDINNEKDFQRILEKDPLPLMVFAGSYNYPLLVNQGEELRIVIGEFDMALSIPALQNVFSIDQNREIYTLRITQQPEFPHMPEAYYDISREFLLLSAMTDKGYQMLITQFAKAGVMLPAEPYIRIHQSVLHAVNDVLGRNVILNPFMKPEGAPSASDPEEDENLDELNALVGRMFQALNENRVPDLVSLSSEFQIDLKIVKDLYRHVKEVIRRNE